MRWTCSWGLSRHATCRAYGGRGRSLFSSIEVKSAQAESRAVRTPEPASFDRSAFDALLRRRLFYTPAFGPYDAPAGLYDYGPPGCSLQANIVDAWRKHFVVQENMLEIDGAVLTPSEVLKASGHVEKFTDWMCNDKETGDVLRVDHLIKDVLGSRLNDHLKCSNGSESLDERSKMQKSSRDKTESSKPLSPHVVQKYERILSQIDEYDGPALESVLVGDDVRNPVTGNRVTVPTPFNLMFETKIGPSGALTGYLRPETAQGQFLNFQKLFEWNQRTMPFATASVGKCFRNEISPKSALLRVREFTVAEIEHFVDPESRKGHSDFRSIGDTRISFLTRKAQLEGRHSLQEMAVKSALLEGIVANETIGYFLARIQSFLVRVGIDPHKIRFRQHLAKEMAHYATDCWDAELLTSYGWIECVGCADRSAYDLSVHSRATSTSLVVREQREEPLRIEEWVVHCDKKIFGPRFRQNARVIEETLRSQTQQGLEEASCELGQSGKMTLLVKDLGSDPVEIQADAVQIVKEERIDHVREYTPHVIEPSFGIGRVLYTLLEHVYWTRPGDVSRGVLSFPPSIAPIKVILIPLDNTSDRNMLDSFARQLREAGIPNRVDASSASIGKRYARSDELGIPFGVTIDFQSSKDQTVTLRERDSTEQVRGSPGEVLAAIKDLVSGSMAWDDVAAKLPTFDGQQQ